MSDTNQTADKPARAKAKPAEPTFAVSRLLDPAEGEGITGLKHPLIVGALHGKKPNAELTRAEVEELAKDFLARPVEMEG